MKHTKMKKQLKKVKRWAHKRRGVFWSAAILITIVAAYTVSNMNQLLRVDRSSYKPLLGLIAKAESKDNYNAYFGNAGNTETVFTKMSVGDVMKWQQEYIAAGSASSAVGRYQIISTTLASLVGKLAIDTSQLFDEAMQDKLAIALLEQRGAVEYVNNRIGANQFAAELAKEWAGLPKVIGDKPEQSYYAGDGLNRSLVSTKDVLGAVGDVRAERE